MNTKSLIIKCPYCGQKNRVLKYPDSGKRPICGKCRQILPITIIPETLTESNFESFIAASEKPVLVDFWAQWCGPCQQMAPVLKEFASMHPEITVAKVEVDANPNLAARFQIFSVPTMILFKNNKEVKRSSGAASLQDLENFSDPLLSFSKNSDTAR